MLINADFSQFVVLKPDQQDWVASPMPGVERKMLDRVGGEVARATSIVRYAPGSVFSKHTHSGGEEFYVLEGVFSDETGDFPAGSYVRNPIGTSHSPFSENGCTIFVKLRQFDPSDTEQKAVDTGSSDSGTGAHAKTQCVHEFGSERVEIVRLESGVALDTGRSRDGQELLVLEGELLCNGYSYPAGSWLRWRNDAPDLAAGAQGCVFYSKTGHLTAQALAHFKEQG
jgi:quercetin dioxygenase-like cupin family protein